METINILPQRLYLHPAAKSGKSEATIHGSQQLRYHLLKITTKRGTRKKES